MKAFVSWSGGKESAWAFYKVRQDKKIKPVSLLNMISEDGKSSRSHGIGSDLLRLQAEAMGIPMVQRRAARKSYEAEFRKALLDFKKEGIEAGVFGDIDFQEHRDWIERVCKESGIKPVLPLWKYKREELLKEFIGSGFKAMVVTTRTNFLGEEWLGREIDKKFVTALKAMDKIDLCGEKGEYHTFVYDGPGFKSKVKFISGKKIFKDKHWFLELIPGKKPLL